MILGLIKDELDQQYAWVNNMEQWDHDANMELSIDRIDQWRSET